MPQSGVNTRSGKPSLQGVEGGVEEEEKEDQKKEEGKGSKEKGKEPAGLKTQVTDSKFFQLLHRNKASPCAHSQHQLGCPCEHLDLSHPTSLNL